MDTHCQICNSPSTFFIEQGGYRFYECLTCKLLFVNPMPTDAELSQVYSPAENYQSHKIHKDYTKEINYKYERIIRELKKLIPPGSTVLDVGASDGDFLYFSKKAGFSVAGVEPNETTAKIANSHGLNVFNGFLEASPFRRGSFAVLRLGDVLEHSNDPNKLMEDCKSFLAPSGLLVISIPNMDSFWAGGTRVLNTSFSLPWSVLTPPHHLLYFSKDNLDRIFKNHGFSLVTSWYHRPPTFKYEFGNTHLYGAWRRNKGLRNILRFVFGFSAYAILYSVDYILTPFKRKDFGMLCIYKKI